MSAPERIWVDDGGYWCRDLDTGIPPDGNVTKYIRADLVPQWQPIETAPKDGAEFLASTECNEMAVVWWHDDYQWWAYYDEEFYGEFAEIVKWMPLPN